METLLKEKKKKAFSIKMLNKTNDFKLNSCSIYRYMNYR